jgi:hypothetical protein
MTLHGEPTLAALRSDNALYTGRLVHGPGRTQNRLFVSMGRERRGGRIYKRRYSLSIAVEKSQVGTSSDV